MNEKYEWFSRWRNAVDRKLAAARGNDLASAFRWGAVSEMISEAFRARFNQGISEYSIEYLA